MAHNSFHGKKRLQVSKKSKYFSAGGHYSKKISFMRLSKDVFVFNIFLVNR